MKRDLLRAGLLWVVLTVVGLGVVNQSNIFPVAAAEEADLIDQAFRFLMILGMPVLTFVLAALGYSLWRFRAQGPEEEGPSLWGHTGVAVAWLVVTSALAVLVIFYPGLTGLAELGAEAEDDLVVQIEAEQWNWSVTYPRYDVSIRKADNLFLPAGQRVRFEITSTDVLHSFWIPAFRLKADAVPGQVVVLYATPNREGDADADVNYRVQCAELCGTGHARMRMDVAVLSPAEFEARMAELQAKTAQVRREVTFQKVGAEGVVRAARPRAQPPYPRILEKMRREQ